MSASEETLSRADGSGGLLKNLEILETSFTDECWKIKIQYDYPFKDALTGYRNSRLNFKEKLLYEWSNNHAELIDLEKLKDQAIAVFEKNISREQAIDAPPLQSIIIVENSPILQKTILGRDDLKFSHLIYRLNNSDWVRQGLKFLGESEGFCPFCQQKVAEQLTYELDSFFDETYNNDLEFIRMIISIHDQNGNLIRKLHEFVKSHESRFIDLSSFSDYISQLLSNHEINKQKPETKKKEPSAIIFLEQSRDTIANLLNMINRANKDVNLHNLLVDNIIDEREKLASNIWRALSHAMREEIETFLLHQKLLNNKIDIEISEKLNLEARLTELRDSLSGYQRKMTSAEPTVQEINKWLCSFGFQSFLLRTAKSNSSFYEIVRNDGTAMGDTLSEGEKTFIAFLYFFYLLQENTSGNRASGDRIVTHNIYFHKEVSYDNKRNHNTCRKYETFWVIRKVADGSAVFRNNHNPVRTSYELLWSEVNDANRSNLSIQNTLRRILEYYFKILGHTYKDRIIEKFEGGDKIIRNSLFSWINDGSHNAHDDLYISVDENMIENYLRVFKLVFERTNNSAHYEMMTGQTSSLPAAIEE